MNVLKRNEKHSRRASAAYKKGHERIEEILDAAEFVFVNEGYRKLTMRQIALQAGMTVGNLTYYYATKEALLQDMLENILRSYLGEMDRAESRGGDTPVARFVAVVEFLIQDLNTPRTTSLFPELWALANHDEYAAKLMEHMYEEERAVLARLIRAANPRLDKDKVAQYALYVSCSI
ncbi:MAG: TetR/AcrR family transcriptional regulator, partial [Lysobacterales bacterium]